jgi:hypothetical protein
MAKRSGLIDTGGHSQLAGRAWFTDAERQVMIDTATRSAKSAMGQERDALLDEMAAAGVPKHKQYSMLATAGLATKARAQECIRRFGQPTGRR